MDGLCSDLMVRAAQGNSPITPSGNSGRPDAISRKKLSTATSIYDAPAPRVKKDFRISQREITECWNIVSLKRAGCEGEAVPLERHHCWETAAVGSALRNYRMRKPP